MVVARFRCFIRLTMVWRSSGFVELSVAMTLARVQCYAFFAAQANAARVEQPIRAAWTEPAAAFGAEQDFRLPR
jgi:hypothetical protein